MIDLFFATVEPHFEVATSVRGLGKEMNGPISAANSGEIWPHRERAKPSWNWSKGGLSWRRTVEDA